MTADFPPPFSPPLGPSRMSSSLHAPALRPNLTVPLLPKPSSFVGRSVSYESVGPAPPCNPPNNCRTSLTAIIAVAGLTPLTSSYSLDTVRSTLASLCPPASDKDTLTPDHLLSIAQSSPLTDTTSDVLAVLEHLPSGAAAGASGWTYATMKAVFLRNGAYSGRTSQLLATFCNLMLSDQLPKYGSGPDPSSFPRKTAALAL
jgi:hypothetical protein